MRILKLVLFLCLLSVTAFAAGDDSTMAFDMRQSGMIYVVVATIAIVFAGIAVYLFSIDKRLKKIERNN
ncbi:CcmD family protein [Hufsiella ginkgonis]|uniref:CcmD family protein n=1 Tax=Hufsiella ginkgonis TaxID=2695274 RepID=A0A7K1XXP3_9SPHI|nr:CcmD family protein [Hufsiella ginkgonis]MXV15598.1 CcmD family protein [Hufsiella ginkgonis]